MSKSETKSKKKLSKSADKQKKKVADKVSGKKSTTTTSKVNESSKRALSRIKKSHSFKKRFAFFLQRAYRPFKKIHIAILDNKVLNNVYFRKFTVIAFYIGLNVVLGAYFLKTNKIHLPGEVVDVLQETGIVDEEESKTLLGEELAKDITKTLDPQVIFELLNKERDLVDASELRYNNALASAAAILLEDAEEAEFDLENNNFLEELKTALEVSDYKYLHVSHNIVIGPTQEQSVVDAWFSDEQQIKAIRDDDFIEVGFATKIVDLDGVGPVGVVVQVLGKPMEVTLIIDTDPNDNEQVAQAPQNLEMPEISDDEVFEALNNYRRSHDVSSLHTNSNLCSYASKRVGDLIAYGGLDYHEGFKKDFEDPENPPDPIKYYSGNQIAENLAFQHCKNMTTGDSFIAETGTALIEWCFDSSTEGHREAQLNRDYKNACVRHGENMYVIIFGN